MFRDATTGDWRRVSYEVWCQCACLLLGWNEGDEAQWPSLYLAGLTPLQAARQTGFGTVTAEAAVWV